MKTLGDENFEMLLGHKVILSCVVRALMHEINAPERSSFLLPHENTTKRLIWKKPLIWACWHSKLGLPFFKPLRNKCFLFISQSTWSVVFSYSIWNRLLWYLTMGPQFDCGQCWSYKSSLICKLPNFLSQGCDIGIVRWSNLDLLWGY